MGFLLNLLISAVFVFTVLASSIHHHEHDDHHDLDQSHCSICIAITKVKKTSLFPIDSFTQVLSVVFPDDEKLISLNIKINSSEASDHFIRGPPLNS